MGENVWTRNGQPIGGWFDNFLRYVEDGGFPAYWIMTSARNGEGPSRARFFEILAQNPDPAEQCAQARKIGCEIRLHNAIQFIESAKTKLDLQKQRALLAHAEMQAACLLPDIYGRASSVDVTINDKRDALSPAERRNKLEQMLPRLRAELAELGLEIVPRGEIVDNDMIAPRGEIVDNDMIAPPGEVVADDMIDPLAAALRSIGRG